MVAMKTDINCLKEKLVVFCVIYVRMPSVSFGAIWIVTLYLISFKKKKDKEQTHNLDWGHQKKIKVTKGCALVSMEGCLISF